MLKSEIQTWYVHTFEQGSVPSEDWIVATGRMSTACSFEVTENDL